MPNPKPPIEIDYKKITPIIEDALKRGWTDLAELERAIGALYIGQVFGWKVLRILHSKNAYSKYEKALDIHFVDVCPPETPHSIRSLGYRHSKGQVSFWKMLKLGLIPKEMRTEVDKSVYEDDGSS